MTSSGSALLENRSPTIATWVSIVIWRPSNTNRIGPLTPRLEREPLSIRPKIRKTVIGTNSTPSPTMATLQSTAMTGKGRTRKANGMILTIAQRAGR